MRVLKHNQDGKGVVGGKEEPKKMAKSSSDQLMGRVDLEPWRIGLRGGSVIPTDKCGKGAASAKKALEKVAKFNPNKVMGRDGSEPWWIEPKIGSVIPARRRSVKRLMLDSVVQLVGFATASASQEASDCGHEVAQLPKVAGGPKIGKRVCPYPPEYGIGFD